MSTTNKLPKFAVKPKHKLPVVATSLGWEVESTGELLVAKKNLDVLLKELYGIKNEPVVEAPTTLVEETKPETATAVPETEKPAVEAPKEPKPAVVDSASVAPDDIDKILEEPPVKKKRGRPSKAEQKAKEAAKNQQ